MKQEERRDEQVDHDRRQAERAGRPQRRLGKRRHRGPWRTAYEASRHVRSSAFASCRVDDDIGRALTAHRGNLCANDQSIGTRRPGLKLGRTRTQGDGRIPLGVPGNAGVRGKRCADLVRGQSDLRLVLLEWDPVLLELGDLICHRCGL